MKKSSTSQSKSGAVAQVVEVYTYGESKQEFWVYRCGHEKRHFGNRRVGEVLAGRSDRGSARDLRQGFGLHQGGMPERRFNIKWMREAPANEENAS